MKKIFLIIFLVLYLVGNANGLDLADKIAKNPIGTEFWLCFMKNHEDPVNNDKRSELKLELFISSIEDTKVTVEIKALRFKKTINVKKNIIQNVKIDKLAQIKSSEIVEEDFAVHIVSEKPISVYGLNRRSLTTDTFLGLPTSVLGKNYRSVCYSVTVALMAQFAIVATEDNTKVRISPTVPTQGGRQANEEFTVTLNQGDVYQVSAKNILLSDLNCDLTGSLIEADKKIAVFSGHQCSYVPYQPNDPIIACNHLVEQLPPISSWGKHYYIGKLKKRSNYNYRVVADQNNTKVFENSKLIGTINSGEFIERMRKEPVQVTSNNPVLVSQYSQGYKNGDSIGDPMMLLISPTQQFLDNYRFATPVNGQWEHFINVVIPTRGIGTLTLNNKIVPSNKFSVIGKSRYSIAYLTVPFGAHDIKAKVPFGMTSYGFGFGKAQFDAYGTIGGQSFLEYIPLIDTIAPTAEIFNREDGNVEVIFRDDHENDLGIASIDVLYSENFNLKIPTLTKGMPQISYVINTKNDIASSIVFRAVDLNGNYQVYSICYDFIGDSYGYRISKGENICSEEDYTIGIDLKSNIIGYDVGDDFLSEAESYYSVSAVGKYKVNYRYSLRLALGYNPINGNISKFYKESFKIVGGEQVPFIEKNKLVLNGSAFNLQFGGEYYFTKNIYFGLGYSSYIISDDVLYKDEILEPVNAAYENGSQEKISENNSFGEFNSFQSGIYIGAGIEMPIEILKNTNVSFLNNILLTFELQYERIFTEMEKNSCWNMDNINYAIGFKYKL